MNVQSGNKMDFSSYVNYTGFSADSYNDALVVA